MSRTEVLGRARERACSALKSTSTLQESLLVVLAASAPRDCEETNGLLLNRAQAELATSKQAYLALSNDEWAVLFGHNAECLAERDLEAICLDTDLRACIDTLTAALRCSLAEDQARRAWRRPLARLACYIALHAEDTEKKVAACLGGFVRADSRRLDEVRVEVEDGEVDHMLLCKAMLALSAALA